MFSRGVRGRAPRAIFKTKEAPRMGSILSENSPVVATETVIVFDAVQNFHRRVVAGQPVPPDLLDAYAEKVGGLPKQGSPPPVDAPYEAPVESVEQPGEPRVAIVEKDYDDADREALEAEVERRRALGRTIEVEGTGKDGNVVKADLVEALETDDENGG